MLMRRFPENPLISPQDVIPSRDGWEVIGAYNCGAFHWQDRINLLVRVIERPIMDDPDLVCAPMLDFSSGEPEMVVKTWHKDKVDISDPRFVKADEVYDAIHSHLRLAWSDDGKQFQITDKPTLSGQHEYEAYGLTDPRVLWLDGRWTIMLSGVGPWGAVMSLGTTQDWETFEHHGIIFACDNKDVALFPERINGKYCCFHRPSGVYFGGNDMWLAYSDDLLHWGQHVPLMQRRAGMWDSARIGCGPEPIKTDEGWLELYHGSDGTQYYLGAVLLDLDDPSLVLARSTEPLLCPQEDYEKVGYYNNVVFPHGLIKQTDDLYYLYYGGADRYTCGCEFLVSDVLASLKESNS